MFLLHFWQSHFALFLKVLFKWKGSVYKLIFKEMFVYLAVYFFLNMLYRTVLLDDPESEWKQYRYAFESLKGTLRNYVILISIIRMIGNNTIKLATTVAMKMIT